ncbi:MAG: thiamine pyrophosphate-dependent enzyme, partial [Pseudonocardiaceae bacterium]
LERLSETEALETYLHKAFLGKKQFSIEGLDALVPMLDETIELAADTGAREVVLGMAHRGRLNVLAHNVGRPYDSILVEFEGEQTLSKDTAAPEGGTGDVKYHYGASGTYKTQSGRSLTVTMSPNPSHLEYVNPVIEGRARADQTARKARELAHDPNAVLPVLIHGDASFPGQGIVAETLNLQALEGYSTGGTVHVIANNQLGFTTDPQESRSTRYASDLAKGFDIPIIHVNADDVEATIAAIRLAHAFRQAFNRDALIDLIGGADVEVVGCASREQALAELDGRHFDCMVLDLGLEDGSGFQLLERIKRAKRFRNLPVIVHTGKELAPREETRLKRYAETIVVKDARSPERLLDETSLYLHRPEA